MVGHTHIIFCSATEKLNKDWSLKIQAENWASTEEQRWSIVLNCLSGFFPYNMGRLYELC